MSIGKRLISTGVSATPTCTTDSTDPFGDGYGVALYSLDYDASTAPDATTDYSGTPTNVEFGVDGHINWGARFNGSSSIISIPQPTLSGGFTLSAWFRTTSSAFQSIITMGGSSAAAGLNIFTNSGYVITSFGNGSSEDYNTTTSSVTVNTGAWFHVVLSTSGLSSGSTVKLYINGQLDDSETSSVNINTTSYTSAFSIGGRNLSGSLSTYFNGDIDQVRVFSKALNQSEVDSLYAETACVYTGTTQSHLFGCIANYNLDGDAKEAMGVTAYDGTESNITYEFGRFGTAAVFNGSSSYIDIPITPSSLGELFSVSIWFKTSTTSTYQTLVDNGGNTSGSSGFAIFINTDNTLRASFTNGGGGGASDVFTLNTNTTVTDGNWHNCILTYNNESAKLYLDNGTPFSGTNTEPFTQAANNIRLGAYVLDNTILEFNGDIDQVRVFSSELTSSQVEGLFNDEKQAYITKSASNPFGDGNEVAFYKMENNAADSTGSNTGTNYGTTFTTTDALFGTYSASFDGSGDSIQINQFSGFTNYNFTLSIWIKTTDTVGYITSFRDPMYITLGTGIYASGTNGMGIYDGTNSYFINNTAMQGINDGNWHHIVMTHDGTNLKGYIDGSIIATVSSGTTTQSSGGTNYNRIGVRADGNTASSYNGLVDQLRLFNRALEGDEVFKLYAEVIN